MVGHVWSTFFMNSMNKNCNAIFQAYEYQYQLYPHKCINNQISQDIKIFSKILTQNIAYKITKDNKEEQDVNFIKFQDIGYIKNKENIL